MNMVARAANGHIIQKFSRAEQSCRLDPRGAKSALIQVQGKSSCIMNESLQYVSVPNEAEQGVFNREITPEQKYYITCFT